MEGNMDTNAAAVAAPDVAYALAERMIWLFDVLTGYRVEVQTTDGKTWEGIFTAGRLHGSAMGSVAGNGSVDSHSDAASDAAAGEVSNNSIANHNSDSGQARDCDAAGGSSNGTAATAATGSASKSSSGFMLKYARVIRDPSVALDRGGLAEKPHKVWPHMPVNALPICLPACPHPF
jgi:hypothetical protein